MGKHSKQGVQTLAPVQTSRRWPDSSSKRNFGALGPLLEIPYQLQIKTNKQAVDLEFSTTFSRASGRQLKEHFPRYHFQTKILIPKFPDEKLHHKIKLNAGYLLPLITRLSLLDPCR
jgi:hypothetical protein